MAKFRHVLVSLVLHVGILSIFVLSFELATLPPVLENSNHPPVINAVILGETPKSKILPQETPPLEITENAVKPIVPPPLKIIAKEIPPAEKPKPKLMTPPDTIALKKSEKKPEKKQVDKKIAIKKFAENLAQDLLTEIKKQPDKKELAKKQFEKTLREQAEKSLRQNLLDEKLKLQAKENKQSAGVVNKYKMLILQAISEKWLIPEGTNKKLSCELLIRLTKNGAVLEVKLVKSSGNPALDYSARAAVLKASPLPVPTREADFSAFQEFALKVKPEDIRQQM
ncbi:MAG: cell envelope integrity protein TolA [Gammaproteobacteria bacterium]|nr:cell envelope integrity protein TolA [Gammaproteobacteria bacterium]